MTASSAVVCQAVAVTSTVLLAASAPDDELFSSAADPNRVSTACSPQDPGISGIPALSQLNGTHASAPAAESSHASAVCSSQDPGSIEISALRLHDTPAKAPSFSLGDHEDSGGVRDQQLVTTTPATPAPLLQNSTASQQQDATSLRHAATEAALLLGTGAILWSALGSSRPRCVIRGK